MEGDDERFRRVHPGASSALGRCIAEILYDRSIRGPNAIGGVKTTGMRRRPRKDMESSSPDNNRGGSIGGGPTVNGGTLPEETTNDVTNPPPASSTEASAPNRNPNFSSSRRLHLNSHPCRITNEIGNYSELYSITKFQSSYLLDESSHAVSTISVSFSHDGMALASTHGDHTVKITCCHSGRLLKCLEGHPRTPWTVKFHPTNSRIVASGCLGFQVRIWNWGRSSQSCLGMIRLDYAIISLAFHPTGGVLAVASGSSLHLWEYPYDTDGVEKASESGGSPGVVPANRSSISSGSGGYTSPGNGYLQDDQQTSRTRARSVGASAIPTRGTGVPHEMRLERSLRCVHFPPGGDKIIVGNVNPPIEGGGGMSFSLKLFDFDLHALEGVKPTMSNPRAFIHRALLYNDGGFDVSPCGKYLCACAEFWLPVGFECAMDLFPREELDTNDDDSDDVQDSSAKRIDDTTQSPPSTSSQSTACSSSSPTKRSTTTTPANISHYRRASSSSSSTTPPRSHVRNAAATTRSSSLSESLQQSWQPVTPPIPSRQPIHLSPPSPPGRRLVSGLTSSIPTTRARPPTTSSHHAPLHRSIPPPPPPHVSPAARGTASVEGRFVPHVVLVSLDTTRPNRLGELLEAAPLDGTKASGVTCVKFSPSADFCLLGYGVRESTSQNSDEEVPCHPVTALYRIRGGMTHVATMMSENDDVNIARFHPHSGHGFVYGTKQGKVRILSPKPWNYFCPNLE